MLAEPYFAKNALALHPLLQNAQSLLNIVITDHLPSSQAPLFHWSKSRHGPVPAATKGGSNCLSESSVVTFFSSPLNSRAGQPSPHAINLINGTPL
jgi:hypothetical protein